MPQILLTLLLALLLLGCSTRVSKPSSHQVTLTPYKKRAPQESSYQLHKKNAITLALFDEYQKWYGVAYKYGGNSYNGVDCSALVQTLYYDAFGIKLPRTTKEQIKRGSFVGKSYLREGDIIFFKTGWNSLHSGIYLERGNFIHASSKHGVTISNLNNPYWKACYLQSRRVLNY